MFYRACANHRLIVCALAMYVIAVIGLAPHFVYRLFPDSISYFSVAKQYAEGHTWEAVNGYWSPLFSWLLVPFLWAGIAPHVASRVLFGVVGAILVVLFHALIGRLGVSHRIQNWATITSIPIIAYCSLTLATPDFLLVGLLLLYYFLLCRPDFASRRWSGVLCGLVGGAAYLCKHYAIAFFAVHFTAFMLARYLQGRRENLGRRVVFHYVAGMAVFLLICSAWIGTMSAKYGRFTVSQAGSYNHSLVGPDFSRSHRLRPPPGPHGLSAWDSPASDAVRPWNPIASWGNVSRKLAQMARTT